MLQSRGKLKAGWSGHLNYPLLTSLSGHSGAVDFWTSATHRWVQTALLHTVGFETNPLMVLGFDYVALKNRLIGYLIITSISDYQALNLFQNLTCFYLQPILLTLKNHLCKYNMRQRGEIKSCLRHEWLHSTWLIVFVFLLWNYITHCQKNRSFTLIASEGA